MRRMSGLTLHQSSAVVRQVPGEVDGVCGDLADPDGGGHGRPHHLHAVADAVLAMDVLDSADNTRQTLPHGGHHQGPIIEDL